MPGGMGDNYRTCACEHACLTFLLPSPLPTFRLQPRQGRDLYFVYIILQMTYNQAQYHAFRPPRQAVPPGDPQDLLRGLEHMLVPHPRLSALTLLSHLPACLLLPTLLTHFAHPSSSRQQQGFTTQLLLTYLACSPSSKWKQWWQQQVKRAEGLPRHFSKSWALGDCLSHLYGHAGPISNTESLGHIQGCMRSNYKNLYNFD